MTTTADGSAGNSHLIVVTTQLLGTSFADDHEPSRASYLGRKRGPYVNTAAIRVGLVVFPG